MKMFVEPISFIVPLRDRREQIPGFLHNIKKYYKNFEIIFCCQDDRLLFRKGQLSNLGFKRAKYNFVAFINLDYRFMSGVDLVAQVRNFDRPIIPFGFSVRVTESDVGQLTIVRGKLTNLSFGGCCVFTRDQFIKSCGNSNLMAGWGPDDNLLAYRTNFCRVSDATMGHVVHLKTGVYFGGDVKLRNQNLKMTDPLRDRKKDGIDQTIATEQSCNTVELNIIEYKFRNICVPDDFEYMDLYSEIEGK